MRTVDLRGQHLDSITLRGALPRAELDVEDAMPQVRPILEQVRAGGADALRALARRFDGVEITHLRVPQQRIDDALAAVPADVRAALTESITRARTVHAAQRPTEHTTQVVPGGTVTQRWVPVTRVGLYVPGGLAVYPSSVVMNVVPAQEAGVGSLAVASPPQRDNDGLPHPAVLAACALLGVHEVYAAGGAQAVAMFAYGVRETDGSLLCPPVDLVTGPGNIWVTAAKRAVRGLVGIDSEAGPTEIAILADDTGDPHLLAADLISQAEHDPQAASVLVTPDAALAGAVIDAVTAQAARTKHAERVRTALSGAQSAIVLVDDLTAGMTVIDAYAAEHLEIHTADAAQRAQQVRNAGAIFVGPYAPVSLGDYCAGSNHVLPTGGAAAYSSGLGVHSFLRSVQVIDYDCDALAGVAGHILALSGAEDLPAHGDAVLARGSVVT